MRSAGPVRDDGRMLALACTVALAFACPTEAVTGQTEPAAETAERSMASAARAFLDTLDDAQRAKARRPFDSAERTRWSYLRGDREGLFLHELTADQKGKALALATSGLSEAGRERVRLIRAIEEINRTDEVARGVRPTYGEDLFALIVFGEPGVAPWGWRLEGHHLGLHFSSLAGTTTVTPLFFGSFPATLAVGADKGKRPLGALQEAAIELRVSLSAEQVKVASLGERVPGDVLTGPGKESALADPAAQGGIAMTDLDAAQRDLLWGLVVRHASDLRGDLASDELRRIKAAGTERLRFGWIGEPDVRRPHYYRVCGPTFAVEFDCSQGDPNHVHCVWNDPTRNFGGDALRDHLRREHGQGGP